MKDDILFETISLERFNNQLKALMILRTYALGRVAVKSE